MRIVSIAIVLLVKVQFLCNKKRFVNAAEKKSKGGIKGGLKGSNSTKKETGNTSGNGVGYQGNYGGMGYQKNMAAITASSILSSILPSGDENQQIFKEKSMVVDTNGNMHVRLDRYYQGLQVVGGDVIVHMDPTYDFINFSTNAGKIIDLDSGITPSASSVDAYVTAKREIGVDGLLPRKSPEVIVYAGGAHGSSPVLAYQVHLQGICADGVTPADYTVIVDATTNEVTDSWNNIKILLPSSCSGNGNDEPTKEQQSNDAISFFQEKMGSSSKLFTNIKAVNATGVGFHNGKVSITTNFNKNTSSYQMMDPSRGECYVIDASKNFNMCEDNDNTWADKESIFASQSAAVDVHYGVQTTWDFLKNVLGRNGIDGNGSGLMSRVHYGYKYNNAFYSTGCECMTFGDGDGINLNPLTTLDVVGHEIFHGVMTKTANLMYSGESGGLNEATSDIFGTMVEFYATNSTDSPDHLIGEEVFVKDGLFLRSMIQPSVDGKSSDCYYDQIGELNVHHSSGPANHFFYLLSEGTFEGIPSKTCILGIDVRVASGYATIKGIGKNKATQIWYLAISAYMTSSTDYAMARDATIQSAIDLYGVDGEEFMTVKKAWKAVGLV